MDNETKPTDEQPAEGESSNGTLPAAQPMEQTMETETAINIEPPEAAPESATRNSIQEEHYKSAIEALLFVSEKPIVLDQFKTVFPELKPLQLTTLVKQVQEDYVNRNAGMVIVDIAGGWQMLSNSHAAGYIREFYKTKTKEKLSRPSLESLAIIAYKQPVSRADLEAIRGVNCDGTVAHLLNKGLIEIVGRKEVPGRPFLYGTTKAFLEYFGLRSLEDLPKLENLPPLAPIEAALTASEAAPDVSADASSEGFLSTEETASQETSGQARLMQEQVAENALNANEDVREAGSQPVTD